MVCPYCKAEIGDDMRRCLNCGEPVYLMKENKKKKKTLMILLIITIVLLIVLIVGVIFLIMKKDNGGPSHGDSPASSEKYEDDEDEDEDEDEEKEEPTEAPEEPEPTEAATESPTEAPTQGTANDLSAKVQLSKREMFIEIGSMDTVVIASYPDEDTGEANEVWRSEDTDVATVNNYGYVTGVSVGETNVILSFNNHPEIEITIKVHVEESTGISTTAQEHPVGAEAGDAYLLIRADNNSAYYEGSKNDILACNAGVAHIEGNGRYTVSVTADTESYRLFRTGDPDNADYPPSGLISCFVVIKNGGNLFAKSVITVNEIRVDGKPIELIAKNYTYSILPDRETAIYKKSDKFESDAVSIDGIVSDRYGKPLDIADAYSAQIVDPDDFSEWTTVEVDFTISGI